MIKSPLRYPGGKSRAVELIAGIIPEYKEFREPFVGGGSIYINQKQINLNAQFWINDLYEPLYLFWSYAKENLHQLIKIITDLKNRFPTGKDLFTYLRTNYNEFTDPEKAAAYFILNRITFSGTSDSGGYSEASFKGRFTDSSIRRVSLLGDILPDIRITKFDYEKVVKVSGEDVFIFLDPPYYSAAKSALYGKNGNLHKVFDHKRFATVMKSCNHKWLITYDDSEYIRELFSFAGVVAWDLKYGMRNVANSSDQNGKELFFSNYISGTGFLQKMKNASK
jgi:DNA adenine methylase